MPRSHVCTEGRLGSAHARSAAHQQLACQRGPQLIHFCLQAACPGSLTASTTCAMQQASPCTPLHASALPCRQAPESLGAGPLPCFGSQWLSIKRRGVHETSQSPQLMAPCAAPRPENVHSVQASSCGKRPPSRAPCIPEMQPSSKRYSLLCTPRNARCKISTLCVLLCQLSPCGLAIVQFRAPHSGCAVLCTSAFDEHMARRHSSVGRGAAEGMRCS